MGNKASVQLEVNTLCELSQSYLDWVETNRASSTYDKHRFYLESFIGHVGKSLSIASLKPHHLTKWTNKPSWGDTSRHDAITVIQRLLNWAVDEGYLPNSPIGKIKTEAEKPRNRILARPVAIDSRAHVRLLRRLPRFLGPDQLLDWY